MRDKLLELLRYKDYTSETDEYILADINEYIIPTIFDYINESDCLYGKFEDRHIYINELEVLLSREDTDWIRERSHNQHNLLSRGKALKI